MVLTRYILFGEELGRDERCVIDTILSFIHIIQHQDKAMWTW